MKIFGERVLKLELEIKGLLRPCIVNGEKALFHRWSDKAEVIPPSPMIGGHPGGQLAQTVAIIEYDDGSVHEAYPSEVRFLDTASQMQEFEVAYYRERLEALYERNDD